MFSSYWVKGLNLNKLEFCVVHITTSVFVSFAVKY